ncbi:MAG: PilT/PilU family type 4a pilus ATPase [Planctomycetes bacterium]|nr:PilT/PilU family type 4a pilus ATPase [Planctomycetota bacterium]
MNAPRSRSDALDSIDTWLIEAARAGASDLHLVVAHPPTLRVHGRLEPLRPAPLDADEARAALESVCPRGAFATFLEARNLDFALQREIDGRSRRFRANFFCGGDAVGACFRVIPDGIPEFAWAGFPRDIAERLASFRNGLVLFSGVAGAGKSTSLAMIINLFNARGGVRIVTIEEPIEYVFPVSSSSMISQREVGRDVATFADGLKYGLRQNPDVFLVGEIRDRETAQLALSAAETGHLVFSTLHTRDAKGAVSRFADLFPQAAQSDIRSQLALSLRAVVSQHLLPSSDPTGKRELALEILFASSAVAAAVRLGKLESIDTAIQTGRSQGMLPLDESVKRLFLDGRITEETARYFMTDIGQLWK